MAAPPDAGRLGELAREHGTPLLVLDGRRVRHQARRLVAAAARFWPAPELFFSVKTCPHAGVLRLIFAEGLGAEVASWDELQRALQAGVRRQQVVLNGRAREARHLARACAMGLRLITVESEHDLRSVASAPARPGATGRRTALGLRLHAAATRRPLLRLRETREALRLADLARDLGHTVAVVHAHPGTNLPGATRHLHTLARALNLAVVLRRKGHPVTGVDLGGGFAVPGVRPRDLPGMLAHLPRDLSHNALILRVFSTLRRGTGGPGLPDPGLPLDALCRGAARLARGRFPEPPRLLLEPGRWLVSAAGTLVLRVADVRFPGRRPEVVLDAGPLGGARPLRLERHRVEPLTATATAGPARVTRLCGPVPTALDRVPGVVRLPPLRPGDLLAVRDAGAYFLSFGRWSGSRDLRVVLEEGP